MLGLSICALFNIYWCFVIVNVVPQRNDQCSGELYSLMMMISSVTYLSEDDGTTCMKNNTLQYSLDKGQVITVILDRLFPDGFQHMQHVNVDNVDAIVPT